MSARDPTQMLEAAKAAFKDSRLIAIIGPPKCGKTVIAALLHNAIVNHFIPKNKKYRIEVENGADFLQKTMNSLKQGQFPLKTPEAEVNKVDMILRQEVGTGGSIELKLRDIAGEVYDDLYGQEVPDSERLFRTLNWEKDKNSPFGEIAFLIFCKMYVILIDSKDFANWSQLSFNNMKLLKAIKQWKTAIKETNKGKITTPVAIMVTKSDTLDEENREKSAKTLIKKYMPDFFQQLDSVVDAKKEFFTVQVEIQRDENNKPKLSDPNIHDSFQVEVPLSYNAKEYTRFISWVDANMKE